MRRWLANRQVEIKSKSCKSKKGCKETNNVAADLKLLYDGKKKNKTERKLQKTESLSVKNRQFSENAGESPKEKKLREGAQQTSKEKPNK